MSPVTRKVIMPTVFPGVERGSPCREVSERADSSSDGVATLRFIDKLRYLKQAWAKNRSAVAEMARHIEQLQSDKRALEAELAAMTLKEAASSHDCNHDALTGLPNRTLIKDRFQQAKALADRRGVEVVVLFLDIDQFKQVNDRFGHTVGDRVLQAAAARLQAVIRATDTACRFGGDEFIVLLTDVEDPARSLNVAQEISKRLANPFHIGASTLALQASVGAAVYPSDGATWEALVAKADDAMYRAKTAARST